MTFQWNIFLAVQLTMTSTQEHAMARCHQAVSHCLNKCWPTSATALGRKTVWKMMLCYEMSEVFLLLTSDLISPLLQTTNGLGRPNDWKHGYIVHEMTYTTVNKNNSLSYITHLLDDWYHISHVVGQALYHTMALLHNLETFSVLLGLGWYI